MTDIKEKWNLVSQGAEARLYEGTFLGEQTIVKERFFKSYRHPVLDKKLTLQRLRHEVRSLVRAAKAGVDTPSVHHVDKTKLRIFLEKINGHTAKTFYNGNSTMEEKLNISRAIGETIAKLHNADITHGDLTTSNIMIRDDDQSIVLIDFGLSASQANVEEKGVDMYVLERAFSSTHRESEPFFNQVLESYYQKSEKQEAIKKKYAQVQARGRKRLAFG